MTDRTWKRLWLTGRDRERIRLVFNPWGHARRMERAVLQAMPVIETQDRVIAELRKIWDKGERLGTRYSGPHGFNGKGGRGRTKTLPAQPLNHLRQREAARFRDILKGGTKP